MRNFNRRHKHSHIRCLIHPRRAHITTAHQMDISFFFLYKITFHSIKILQKFLSSVSFRFLSVLRSFTLLASNNGLKITYCILYKERKTEPKWCACVNVFVYTKLHRCAVWVSIGYVILYVSIERHCIECAFLSTECRRHTSSRCTELAKFAIFRDIIGKCFYSSNVHLATK